MDSMAKWRKNLGDTGFLPPPGGAQAADNVTSCQRKKEIIISLLRVKHLYQYNNSMINKKCFKILLILIFRIPILM